MFRKRKKKQTPVRLHKVEEKPRKQYNNYDYFFTFIMLIGLLLGILLFLCICFVLIPKTYGFFWY